MSFTEMAFFPFLLLMMFIYYQLSETSFQVLVLVIGSLFFYSFRQPSLLFLLVVAVCINTVCSHYMPIVPRSQRNRILIAGVAVNLGMLFVFKYLPLVATSIGKATSVSSGLIVALQGLPLPLGISFFAFHGISLLVDGWRVCQHEGPPPRTSFSKHLANTSLYICFFPQLVSGPITKSKNFFPQIAAKKLSDVQWISALDNLLIGYFLKLFVANNIGGYTFLMQYPFYTGQDSISLIALLWAFSIQIFADFAGYSLIAIGLAELFGYELPTNFLFPYISRSFSEFWTRWHISLSSWLRDYLFIPLGGSRVSSTRTYINLMTVMVLGGLWHGAGWSYATWGFAHGGALMAERPFLHRTLETSQHFMLTVLRCGTVLAIVTLAWLLFKLPDMNTVCQYLLAIYTHGGSHMNWLVWSIIMFSTPVIIYHANYVIGRKQWIGMFYYPIRGLMLALILVNSGPDQPFIYFQF